MKRNTAAVLAVVLSLSLSACGNQSEDDNEAMETQESAIYTEILKTATESEEYSEAEAPSETEELQNTEISEITEADDVVFCAADITAAMLDSVDMSSMAEVGYDRLMMYLDLDISENSDFSMYICGSGGFADEVFVLEIGELDTDTIEAAVNKRIEARKKDFEGYNPDEYDKLDNYFCKEKNGYFIYAVTSDNEMCESIFDEYVK